MSNKLPSDFEIAREVHWHRKKFGIPSNSKTYHRDEACRIFSDWQNLSTQLLLKDQKTISETYEEYREMFEHMDALDEFNPPLHEIRLVAKDIFDQTGALPNRNYPKQRLPKHWTKSWTQI